MGRKKRHYGRRVNPETPFRWKLDAVKTPEEMEELLKMNGAEMGPIYHEDLGVLVEKMRALGMNSNLNEHKSNFGSGGSIIEEIVADPQVNLLKGWAHWYVATMKKEKLE